MMHQQRFEREAIHTHCAGPDDVWPDFLGTVQLGEAFVMETEHSNAANGPIAIEGVNAREDIAIHIEGIELAGPMKAPNGGPFDDFEPVDLRYRGGYLWFPERFRLRARPAVGNVAVLPEPTEDMLRSAKHRAPDFRGWRRMVNDPRGKHCHQDCPWLGPGATIHMKAQVDGAGLCMADCHAYVGEGEMAFDGVGVAADIRARVERSEGWLVDWPLVETEDEIMVCGSGDQYVQVVREAFRALREIVAAKVRCSVQEANVLVATAVNLRNCAVYGLGDGYLPGTDGQPSRDLAVVAAIPKDVFV